MSDCCSSGAAQGRRSVDVVLDSVIHCPHCGTSKAERMPVDACRIVYECTGCGAILRPKPGDCCVFCSYGSVPCPPISLSLIGSEQP
jgi:hypothetical protein